MGEGGWTDKILIVCEVIREAAWWALLSSSILNSSSRSSMKEITIMDQHSKHEHSRTSVGLAVIRCSLCFVFVIVCIPVFTTLLVLRDNDNPGISIWWLRPIDMEELVEEESEQIIATQLKLRKWAKKQKELALEFVSAGK